MTFLDLLTIFTDLIYLAIPVLFAITIGIIIFKLGRYWIWEGNNSYERPKGSAVALTGVLVLAAMVSVWGLVRLVQNSIFGW